MRKLLCAILSGLLLFTATACLDQGGNSSSQQDPSKIAEIIPTVYDNFEVKNVEDTLKGDIDSWKAQVFTSNGGNNDDVTTDTVIKSPWHTLSINGVSVPVYTARCGKGAHSFAWVDVATAKDDFILNVTLEMYRAFKKCVVLPLNKGVEVDIEDKAFTAVLVEYGSYTFTFATSPTAKVTNPELAPLTIMVTEEQPLEVPKGYDVHYIEAGFHENDELVFTEERMVYYVKSGLHDISTINLPSDSVLYLERGAYLKCKDRILPNGKNDNTTAIEIDCKDNVKVIGRGLLDMGECLGGDGKYKHVFKAKGCEDFLLDGLTIINSNTWTVTLYNCDKAVVSNNLLLSYRTYSDGIMMSECRSSVGRYNFVRTGDDGIEFKGTGWCGSAVGSSCLYEYNDVWTDKGTAYGVVWESACDMNGMTFRNNNVGFAQPVWKTTNNVLDCRLGTNANTCWSNITFENIDIYHVYSPNVMMIEMRGTGAILEGVTYKNINVNSTEFGVFAFGMYYSGSTGQIYDIKMSGINMCGKILTAEDKTNETLIINKGGSWFGELTIS